MIQYTIHCQEHPPQVHFLYSLHDFEAIFFSFCNLSLTFVNDLLEYCEECKNLKTNCKTSAENSD